MYDRETDSLWSHLTGEALKGKMRGKKLRIISSVPKIRWGAWKQTYPKTKVLSIESNEDIEQDRYEQYHRSDRTGRQTPENIDTRLRPKEMVVGVITDGKQKAYAFSAFTNSNFVYDKLGAKEIIVYRNNESELTAVYEAYVDGNKIAFTTKKPLHDFSVEDGSGTKWNLITGQAREGKHNGKKLKQLPHINAYWFAWSDYYPKTELFKAR